MNRKLEYFRRIFCAPDTETAPAGGASPNPALAAETSPTGAPIPTAPAKAERQVEVVQPKEIIKKSGIVDVQKALGLKEKPSEMIKKEAKALQERTNATTIVPTPKIKSKKPAETVAVEDPEKAKADAEAKAAAEAAAAAPAPAKVKIGDKEMTQEEVAKYVADLEKKANAKAEEEAAAALKLEQQAKVEKTPEEKAAELAKRSTETAQKDAEFITKQSANFKLKSEDLDVLLAGGEKAVEMFARIRAQDALAQRKWFEAVVNPILKNIDTSIDPVLKQHQEIEQYRAEQEFYTRDNNANADLKTHQKTVRMIAQTLRDKYPEEYAKLTPAERDAEIATHTRAFIKEFGGQAQPVQQQPTTPAAAAAPVVKPAPKPKPAPATGQVGGQAAPTTANPQGSMVANLMAFEAGGRRK